MLTECCIFYLIIGWQHIQIGEPNCTGFFNTTNAHDEFNNTPTRTIKSGCFVYDRNWCLKISVQKAFIQSLTCIHVRIGELASRLYILWQIYHLTQISQTHQGIYMNGTSSNAWKLITHLKWPFDCILMAWWAMLDHPFLKMRSFHKTAIFRGSCLICRHWRVQGLCRYMQGWLRMQKCNWLLPMYSSGALWFRLRSQLWNSGVWRYVYLCYFWVTEQDKYNTHCCKNQNLM